MKKILSNLMLVLCLFFMALPMSYAEKTPPIDQRVQRIERLLDSRALTDMLMRLDQLQQEVGQLRGQMEEQVHSIDTIKKRQKDLYVDIDRRLRQLEVKQQQSSNESQMPVMMPENNGSTITDPSMAEVRPEVEMQDLQQQQIEYEQAFALLKAREYKQAGAAFKTFVKQYPESHFVSNAQYWLAECYYVTNDYSAAQIEFEKVLALYENSVKLPDAKLKIAYIHYESKDYAQARTYLNDIVQSYPDSSAARLANVRLQKMKNEGH